MPVPVPVPLAVPLAVPVPEALLPACRCAERTSVITAAVVMMINVSCEPLRAGHPSTAAQAAGGAPWPIKLMAYQVDAGAVAAAVAVSRAVAVRT